MKRHPGALTWLWYELDQNPNVEARMLEEIRSVVGDAPLAMEHVPRLTYTRMVIDECLRLHPPFWFENRNVACDTTLGGHPVPKGSLIVFSRYSLHRHPDFWKEPDRFDPLRQDPNRPENSRSSHAQIPFGGGSRICVGLHFAVLELVVVAVELARRCRIVVDASDRHEMAAQLTMAPRYGVKVRIEQR